MLRVHAFRGVSSFPLRIAVDRGHFARQGLDVRLTFTSASSELMKGLIDGAYEVVQAAPDNFVAWRDNTKAPIVAWYGGSSGVVRCVVRPQIKSLADLRGAQIAVDAPDAGWAPILLGLLKSAGVPPNEVTQIATGATAQVFDALITGRTPAAMLNEPWATRAEALGCRVAGDHRLIAPSLQTSAGASLEPWLARNDGIAVAFLRAVIDATIWLRSDDSRLEVIGRLSNHLGAPMEETAQVVARMVDPDGGWPPSAALNPLGVSTVRDLRATSVAVTDEPIDAYMRLDIQERALDESDFGPCLSGVGDPPGRQPE